MIPAGESGKLAATVKTNLGRTGRQTKSIMVDTDAPDAKRLRLTVSYNVVTPIVVTPSYRVSLNAVEGTPSSSRILLHREDGEPLVVELEQAGVPEGVSLALEPVTAPEKAEGRAKPKTGDVWIVASVDGTVGVMNHNGVVSLTTNHPEAPRVDVPVYVRVRSMIDVRPQRINLWPPEGGPHGSTTLVRLSHSQRRKFEVTSVEVSDPELLTAVLQSQGEQQMHSVRITLAEGVSLNGSDTTATVRIATSDEAKPTLDIPVVITTKSRAVRRTVPPKTPPSTAANQKD